MINMKIINKFSTLFAAVSIVFVIISAIITYLLLQIVSPTAPADYNAYYVLTTIMPYLFIAVLTAIVAYKTKSNEETPEEALPQAETAEANA
jgi:O-antigen/teichoic acid export membrane protein